MNCTSERGERFLTNAALGIAFSVHFMLTNNPLGFSVVYSTAAFPLHLLGCTPAPFMGIGLGLVGRSFINISPLVEFGKVGPVTSWGSRLLSPFKPLVNHWKPILQFTGGASLAHVAISWAGEVDFKTGLDTCGSCLETK